MNFIYDYVSYYADFEELNIAENRMDILSKLEAYELAYRSTVHFTENGLVVSHMYGNFDNRPFIILEPLVEQLNSNIRNFAGQDTFIKGEVTLSEKAIIIVRSEDYDSLKQTYPEIENFNVVLYNGITKENKEKYIKENEDNLPEFDVNDERAVVEMSLMDLGYTPELIGTHYLINSPTSEKINQVNKELATKYNTPYWANHCNTDEYKEDTRINLLITEIFNKLLLDFIIKRNGLDASMFEGQRTTRYTAERLIMLIGIEKIIDDIEKFNATIEKMQELNLIPTAEELINNNIPNIYDNYIQLSTNNDLGLK